MSAFGLRRARNGTNSADATTLSAQFMYAVTSEYRPMRAMACTGRFGSGRLASRSSSRNTGRDETQACAAIMAIENCIPSSRSAHMPLPQARTDSLRLAPAPAMASPMAATVRSMQTTQESGIQRWVKRQRRSPRSPTTATMPPGPPFDGAGDVPGMSRPRDQDAAAGACGGFDSIRAPRATTDNAAAT